MCNPFYIGYNMNKNQYIDAKEYFKGYVFDDEIVNIETFDLYHDIYKNILKPVKINIVCGNELAI